MGDEIAELRQDVERLRRQNHAMAAAHDRETASLRSRVAVFEAARDRARELVRGSPVDWTDDPPSREPDGWWKYTSQQNREILIAALVERDGGDRLRKALSDELMNFGYDFPYDRGERIAAAVMEALAKRTGK